MSKRNLLSRNLTESPACLLRLLHRIAALSLLLILSVSGWGIHHIFEAYVVQRAEDDAVSISKLIMNQQNLMTGGGQELIQISVMNDAEREQLETTLKRFLIPFDILKIKIYDPAGTIIYSTVVKEVGNVLKDSPRLSAALSGKTDTRMQTREEIHDPELKARHQADVVETYIPVYNDSGQVIGSFELYKDISRYRKEIVTGVLTSVAVLTAIMGLVFSLAYVVVRMAVHQLADTQQTLQQIATRDSLTDLLNRREIMARAEQEFARHRRSAEAGTRSALSVIMVDIDHFKQINDHFGHPAGDQVLRDISALLKKQLRSYTLVGRYGGEEFLILLPETGTDRAVQVAERLRLAVKQVRFPGLEAELAITLSLGVATIIESDADFDQLLIRADRALYRAKETGRDRVVTHSAPEQLSLSPTMRG